MKVIRFELANGYIVYSRKAEPEAIRQLMGETHGAQRLTVMDLPEAEFYRLPLMRATMTSRDSVSRWEGHNNE